MERAGLDEREVRDERAEVGAVLEPAHEVRVRRVLLEDHGGAPLAAAVHEDVHAVAVEERARRRQERQRGLAVGGAAEVLGVRDQVLLDAVEVAPHGVEPREPLAQLADELPRRRRGDLGDERLVLRARLALELAEPPERLLHRVLEAPRAGREALPRRLGQRVELLAAQRLAARRRRHGEPGRAAQHGEAGLARRRLEAPDLLLLALAEALEDLRFLALELLALEGPRQPRLALLDEPGHLLGELAPAPGRHLERRGPVGVGEVVDVAVVGADRLVGRRPGEHAAHRRRLAGRRRTQDEQVVAGVLDADAEGGRAQRAVLADHAVERRQLLGGAEAQAGGVTDEA